MTVGRNCCELHVEYGKFRIKPLVEAWKKWEVEGLVFTGGLGLALEFGIDFSGGWTF